MVLFLVAAVPVFTPFFVNLCFFNRPLSREAVLFWLKGFLLFFPALIVLLLLRNIPSVTYTLSGLYLYYLVHDYLVPYIPGLLGYILVFHRVRRGGRDSLPLETFLFFAGYFALFGVLEMVINFMWYDGQLLFLRPVMFLTQMLFLSGMGVSAIFREGRARLLLYIATLIGPVVFALIPSLYRVSSVPTAIILCFAFFGGAVFLFLRVCEIRLKR